MKKRSPGSSLARNIARGIVATLATAAVNSLINYGKNRAVYKFTNSFTASRGESSSAFATIARWLVRDGLLDIRKHSTISTFYVEDAHDSTSTTVSLPPPGVYYARYHGVRLKITISKGGQSHGSQDLIVKISAFNDFRGVLMAKIDELFRDELDQNRLRIEDLQHGRFVLKEHRGFDSIILDPEVKAKLVRHLDWWRNARPLYAKHGITYKTGIFLEGPPGTGKTSLSQAIASYLGYDLFIMSANDLARTPTLRKNSVVLIEDVDRETVAPKSGSKSQLDTDLPFGEDLVDEDVGETPDVGPQPAVIDNADPMSLNSFMDSINQSLVGKLLQVLDGALSPEGVVFIMSANNPERVDPTIIRKGRIDLRLHLGYFTEELAIKLGAKFGVSSDVVLSFPQSVWRKPSALQLALLRHVQENEMGGQT